SKNLICCAVAGFAAGGVGSAADTRNPLTASSAATTQAAAVMRGVSNRATTVTSRPLFLAETSWHLTNAALKRLNANAWPRQRQTKEEGSPHIKLVLVPYSKPTPRPSISPALSVHERPRDEAAAAHRVQVRVRVECTIRCVN